MKVGGLMMASAIVSLIAVHTAFAQAKYPGASADITDMIDRVQSLQSKCRGGSGDNPATMQVCSDKDLLVDMLRQNGWCFGAPGQAEYQKKWQRCVAASAPQAPPSTPPQATLPYYRVEEGCKRVASLGGEYSESVMAGCLRNEQHAYDLLKPQWDQLPAAMKATCDRVARVSGPGSYSVLAGCIQNEKLAAQQNREFKFQR